MPEPGQEVVPREPDAHSWRTGVLEVVGRLVEALDVAGVAYCHWKSNEHLGAAAAGDTDLDLLVDRRAADGLVPLLSAGGFKRFSPPPGRGYVGIEDYLALDPRTGKLVHLHLHYRLVVGEPFLKGYHLPWEDLVLSTRVRDPETGIYMADPHVELLILLVRAAMKLRARDIAAGILGARYIGDGPWRELRWLADRIDPDRLRDLGRRRLGEEATMLIPGLIAARATVREMEAFRRSISPLLRAWRTRGAIEGRLSRWRREGAALWGRAGKRYFGVHSPTKRIVASGGVVIAIIGADGSGKSTIVRELTRWLSWKVDVAPIYFGSGNGPMSLPRRSLGLVAGVRSAVGRLLRTVVGGDGGHGPRSGRPGPGRQGPNPEAAPGRRRPRPIQSLWNALWAWSIAREKRDRLRQARRARARGMVVLCDRFPQSQFIGFNDGPLLSDRLQGSPRWTRALARWEAEVYEMAADTAPDLVVKLIAPVEIAWTRKPERPIESLARRVDAVRALRFPPATRVVEVDAAQPLESVLAAVKRAVWEVV